MNHSDQFQLYEGTKRVRARPMTRGDYNAYRGWQVPTDENPADEGYLVEYEDGGKSNHPDHKGYISWSPKDVFERAYKLVQYQELPPYQQRVYAEAEELTDRLNKLTDFVQKNPVFQTLPAAEQGRMKRQGLLMAALLSVLTERIDAFHETNGGNDESNC